MSNCRASRRLFVGLLVLLGVCACVPASAQTIHPVDRELLLQIMGNSSILPPGWSAANIDTACQWSKLTCLSSGHIGALDLERSLLFNGPLPMAFTQFPALHNLDLAETGITGSIPPEIFRLPLVAIRLASNSLEGTIPLSILNCTTLEGFNVESNSLTGTIPAGLEDLPRLTQLSIYRNRFLCPFPMNLFNRLTQRNSSFCLMSLNNWDSALNGKLCNTEQLTTPHAAACSPFPLSGSPNVRPLQPDLVFDTPISRIEFHGPQFSLFAKMPNGTVFRDEYVSLRVYGISIFVDTGLAPAPGRPPNVRQLASVPITKFTSLTQIRPGAWEIGTYWNGTSVSGFIYTIDTNYSFALGGFKISWRVIGTPGFCSNYTRPCYFGMPLHYEVRGDLFNSSSILICNSSESSIDCSTNKFSSFATGNILSSVAWTYRSAVAEFKFDVPIIGSDTENGQSMTVWTRRRSIFNHGFGPLVALYGRRVWDFTTPRVEDQSLHYTMELIGGPIQQNFYYDPTISMRLLFGDETTSNPPTTAQLAQENSYTTLAIAISVPIVIVVVASIIAVIALVPSVRRRVFAFERAMHETGVRIKTDALRTQSVPPSSPEESPQPSRVERARIDSSWKQARPSVEAV